MAHDDPKKPADASRKAAHLPASPETRPGGDAEREFRDGQADGFEALAPLDPERTDTADALLGAMERTAFSGRRLGEAAEIVTEMSADPDCFVVCTLSGAMTVAKMGMVITRMIEWGMIDCLVSTGALMAHGLTEAIGLTHYKRPDDASDEELYRKGYNRVYDTLEMEQNLNDVERIVHAALQSLPAGTQLSSETFCRTVGAELSRRAEGPGVLRAAYEHGVPVYVPAFTDSEIGLDVATWAVRRALAEQGKKSTDPTFDIWSVTPPFNPFLDLMSYAKRLQAPKRLGIFTIGGGVPRNWAQQAGPFMEILDLRLDITLKPPRFHRAVRICPEPVHWGGLSGCTYSEGVSWGKFVPPAEGGRFAEVHADATVAWPLLVRGVIERLQAAGHSKRSPQPAAS